MRGPWRGVASLGLADVLEQRRAQALHELRGDDVGCFRAAVDPLAQMVEVELFGGLGHGWSALGAGRFRKFDVVADGGHGAITPLLADEDRGRRGVAYLAVRRVDLDAAQMRMHGEVGHGVHFGERDVGLVEALQQFDARHRGEAIRDRLVGE